MFALFSSKERRKPSKTPTAIQEAMEIGMFRKVMALMLPPFSKVKKDW